MSMKIHQISKFPNFEFLNLLTLNSSKSTGPDGIPSWVLKENGDILAKPIKDIVNKSYCKAHLPQSWN